MLGNHINITYITVILSSSELESLKKKFEASWGWNFSEAKSRVPRPRHSLPPTSKSSLHLKCRLFWFWIWPPAPLMDFFHNLGHFFCECSPKFANFKGGRFLRLCWQRWHRGAKIMDNLLTLCLDTQYLLITIGVGVDSKNHNFYPLTSLWYLAVKKWQVCQSFLWIFQLACGTS